MLGMNLKRQLLAAIRTPAILLLALMGLAACSQPDTSDATSTPFDPQATAQVLSDRREYHQAAQLWQQALVNARKPENQEPKWKSVRIPPVFPPALQVSCQTYQDVAVRLPKTP